jgi:hypothetical protein
MVVFYRIGNRGVAYRMAHGWYAGHPCSASESNEMFKGGLIIFVIATA